MSQEEFKDLFFQVFSQHISDVEKIEKIYKDVIKRYSAKNRYYHNLKHIYKMCEFWILHKDKLKNPNIVFYAIIFHDIIYKTMPGQVKTSEELSADYFFKKIGSKKWFSLSSSEVFSISDLIKQTANIKLKDVQLFMDMDFSILGSSESDYDEYTKGVRKEYSVYNNFLYKKGRLDFLEKMLNRENIFLTPEFRKFEKISRKNILNEINLLNLPKKRK